MSEDADQDNKLLGRVDEAIVNRSNGLRYPDALEQQYQSDNLAARAQHARYAGWAAVLAYNVMLTVKFVTGEFPAHAIPTVLLAAHGLVTAPSLMFIFLARFESHPRRLDSYMAAAYAMVTLASVVLNLNMNSHAATYDAFTSVLIPVTCNIALPRQ